GSAFRMKLTSPCLYSVTFFERCRAAATNPICSNSAASCCGSGPVYSTNSNPSVPIGLSQRSCGAGLFIANLRKRLAPMWSRPKNLPRSRGYRPGICPGRVQLRCWLHLQRICSQQPLPFSAPVSTGCLQAPTLPSVTLPISILLLLLQEISRAFPRVDMPPERPQSGLALDMGTNREQCRGNVKGNDRETGVSLRRPTVRARRREPG